MSVLDVIKTAVEVALCLAVALGVSPFGSNRCLDNQSWQDTFHLGPATQNTEVWEDTIKFAVDYYP